MTAMRWAALALAAVARAVVTQPKPTVTPPTPAVAPRTGKLGEFDFDKLAPYEQLRGEFDREKILGFMAERPLVVAKRQAARIVTKHGATARVASVFVGQLRERPAAREALRLAERQAGHQEV